MKTLDIAVTTYSRWLIELTVEDNPNSPTYTVFRIRGFDPRQDPATDEPDEEKAYYYWEDALWLWESLTPSVSKA